MRYTRRLTTPEEFGDIVIRSADNGEVLKLKDVTDTQLGQDSHVYHGGMDGHSGASYIVFQTTGSNTTEVNQNIDKLLEEASRDPPEGVELTRMMNSNDLLFAPIHEVVKTLIKAIILATFVIYVFLQNFRSISTPLAGIVISLVGTFASIVITGSSINLLALFALVLVTNTVVNDAIIVVEAAQARFDAGCRSSYMASIDAVRGISNAVITSPLVFMVVFIPVSFVDGTSGTFYARLGPTMAVAVGVFAINASTLSPALRALLSEPYINEDGMRKGNFVACFRKAFNLAFGVMVGRYGTIVLFFTKRRWLT